MINGINAIQLEGALFLTHSHVGSGEAMAHLSTPHNSLLCVGVTLGFLRLRTRNGTNCMCWLHASGTSSWNEMQKKNAFQRAQPKKELLKTMIFGAALKSLPFTGLLKTPISGQPTVKPRVRRPFRWRTAGWLTIGPPGSRCVASLQSAPSLVFSDDHSEPKWEVTMGCPPIFC